MSSSRSAQERPSIHNRLLITLALLLLSVIPHSRVNANEVVSDIAIISTIGTQSASDSIYFSSAIFLTSGSSLTLQGANGHITTGSSVTASTYRGDGSNLTGTGGIVLTATQTFSGATTFYSSFTVRSNGREIGLSTTTSANIISISSAGAIIFAPTLHNSTATTIPAATTTNSALGPCLSGSTLTIVTTGGQVEAQFSAFITNPNTSSTTAVGILQDGQFVSDMSSTKPLMRGSSGAPSARAAYLNTFSYLFTPGTPGAHTYCISLAAPDGGDAAITNAQGVVRNFFFLKELK